MNELKISKLGSSKNNQWDEIWDLYQSSFPLPQKRRLEEHISAEDRDEFHTDSFWIDNKLIGFAFFWDFHDWRYLEYIAISDRFKAQGYGSKIIKFLTERPVILEIDPPIGDYERLRLRFYEKNGLHMTPFHFLHLPYNKVTVPEELSILTSFPNLPEEKFMEFKNTINNELIDYCE